jgi:hypothetical protein
LSVDNPWGLHPRLEAAISTTDKHEVEMKLLIASTLFLATAATAGSQEITISTPARAISILKDESLERRVLISPQIVRMDECEAGMRDQVKEMKADVLIALCVPADMTGDITGTAPVAQP